MHIKRMHEMIEKLTKCAEMEFEKGIDKIDAEEMGEVTDMIKDLAEAEYYAKISKAMDEAEYGEDYDYRGAYDEYERKGYRGQMRDSKGRYTKKRGYMPDMMHDDEWEDMQMARDMDRHLGRMGYTEPMTMHNGNQTHSESRYDRARKGYEESKVMHKDNSPESKQHKMKELENYMKELSTDVTEMITDMSPEEKALMKQKMSVLMQKI
jgi:hypothetical protein